ncbi:class I SAM-dependent methyltransferase [Ancylomarina euxinus]|uniref:Class I SAM-dependent methyltransferase n=1 Tax=Ancylomarina euxinus TaxID=2283627 RepID=A0A425Y7I3_9BACT|nr:class I SAM-dependent methyltransferase [Ancylomarina euxinus]MCZ4693615.1 class I SAM-dependent methyltransferase [Ancylomarina euxinus]MUP13843.1 methyltransferase domain-containing protein [Ancylomarina euxinus]RRG24525.1 class I SAM-dependent methyltransferase [Ancylomarina euxinus]
MKSNQYEMILDAIEKMGISKTDIARKHTSAYDEFHVRGRAVSEELFFQIELINDSQVLDLGCGLGGTCRMLAEKYDCMVHGIDYSEQHISTAKSLSKLTGFEAKTEFIQADATQMPYSSDHFDLVITQHVQMCIADKDKLYSEVERVLKKGGHFIYYDVLKKSDEAPTFPQPWVDNKVYSFLISSHELENKLCSLGFKKIASEDQSQKGLNFLTNFLTQAEEKPAILTGQKILMGDNSIEKITNLYQALKDGIIGLESGTYEL